MLSQAHSALSGSQQLSSAPVSSRTQHCLGGSQTPLLLLWQVTTQATQPTLSAHREKDWLGLPDKVLLSLGDMMRVRCDSWRDCRHLFVLLWVPGCCSTVLTAGTSAESKQSPQMTWRLTNKTHFKSLVHSIEGSVLENQMGNPKSLLITVLQRRMWC